MIELTDFELAELVLGERQLNRDHLAQCAEEGILPLVQSCEPSADGDKQQATYRSAVWETAHLRVVSEVLGQLAAQGIRALIIKGTALAYSIYADPWQRSRLDTDLFIDESDVDAAILLLESIGYERETALPGRLAMAELAFYFEDEFGVVHTIDLHWRLNNNWRLASALTFSELWQAREPLKKLSPEAYGPSHADSLLIACVHRAAHATELAYEHSGGEKMKSDVTIWIYDLHLLSELLDQQDWQRVCDRAISVGLADIVNEGLVQCARLFGSPVPETVFERLRDASGQITSERFSDRTRAEWLSFLAIPGTRKKFRFLLQQLFPAASYMRLRYPGEVLAWAYAKRILSGLLYRAT